MGTTRKLYGCKEIKIADRGGNATGNHWYDIIFYFENSDWLIDHIIKIDKITFETLKKAIKKAEE